LIILAENKYKALVRLGELQAPTKYQKEILEMRVQMDELEKKKESCSRIFEWNKKMPSDLK